MIQRCEACELAEGEIVDSCDDDKYPYILCAACHHRLHARSLRPLEWYNLAKRHGWQQYLLRDDFYDEDGTAYDPEVEVENAQEFLAPTLAEATQNAESLLDYSITRWHLNSDIAAAWNTFDPPSVLSTLSVRFASTLNIGIRAKILSICSFAVREFGADFVRLAWEEYPEGVFLTSLAEASAACLPQEEGMSRVQAALAKLEVREKRGDMFGLSYFHSSETLTWIEQNIFEPITEHWGNLAAASNISWPCVESWLHAGRPLSLVAIDALAAIARPMTFLLREFKPKLHLPPAASRFREVLMAYRERDPVPRVQTRIDALLAIAGEPTIGLTN
jgi:hypothetical protein